MTERYAGPALWAAFALVLVIIASQLLSACDLGRPVFGLRYCGAGLRLRTEFTEETLREEFLRRRLRAAEFRITELPACAPKPQPVKEPEPQKRPDPKKPEAAVPPAPDRENLEFPTRPEDLKGCWQSDRGDIDIYTDEEKPKPVGKVRICLCFRANGRGEIRYMSTDGQSCRGPLASKLGDEKFQLKQPVIHCMVAQDYTCAKDAEGFATCEVYSHSKFHPGARAGEKYHRVDNGLCEWRE